jgi:hypothetical protein
MRRGLLILAFGVLVLSPVAGQREREQGAKRQTILRGHSSSVFDVAFSQDGRFIA